MTYSIFYSTKSLQLFLEGIAIVALLIAFAAPQTAAPFFRHWETRFAALVRKPWRAIAAAAFFPLIVRALLLPVFPLPLPRVHDEFSYLLLGDTLAHGRLANPSPPFWKHFETEYELVKPTYASQYQPAQGIALAAGQRVTGYAWWGVWLSVGLMCGALCWALAALLPWRWAFFGSALAALQFGIYGFWMNSYFGGAVAAMAGALVFGAIARPGTTSNAAVCALGLIVLFASRPLEGLLWLCIVCAMALPRRRRFAWRPALAFVLALATGAAALAYYNAKVTGDPAESPYALYRADYGTPQSYWWQPPVIVRHFDHPELEANYRDQLRYWQRRYSAAALWDSTWRRLRDFWRFFIGPFLTPALLFTVFSLRRKKLRPWLWVSGIFILDHATYHAWYPQQSAGETVLILLLLVESWRHLRAWQRRKSLGVACSRQLILGFALALVLLGAGLALKPMLPDSWSGTHKILAGISPAPDSRQRAVQLLRRIPGKHLVFVRYEAKHNWYDEWVFNDADIDSSRIVFARVCTPDSDRALADSMKDRDVWIADLGVSLELSRLAPPRPVPASADLASKISTDAPPLRVPAPRPAGIDLAFALPATP